jgi:hypothetical protein
MSPEQARQLLGGLAAGILTPEERRTLFEAALDDQALFNEVAEEMEFAAFLESPETRAQLANRIAIEPQPQRWWAIRPAWLGLSGVIAAMLVVYLAIPHRVAELPAVPVAAPPVPTLPVPSISKAVKKAPASPLKKVTVQSAPATEPTPPRPLERMAAPLAPASPVATAPPPTVALSGSVHDAAGTPVPGAIIDIRNSAAGAGTRVKTDSGGHFTATAPPGPYTVIASASGFKKKQQSVALEPGRPAQIDIPLQVGQMAETVTVAAAVAPAAFAPAAQASPRSGLTQVAVLDFVNGGDQSGAKVADLLADQLRAGGQVAVIDRDKTQQAVQNQPSPAHARSPQQAAAVGRTVGADAVVVGSIQSPKSVTAEVIDTRSAAPVATVAARAASLQSAAISLGNQIQSNLVEGTVTHRKGDIVTINFVAPPRLRGGAQCDVYHGQNKIGQLVITAVHGQSATGNFHGHGHPRNGDRVRLPSVP